jgi:hypothetical protein
MGHTKRSGKGGRMKELKNDKGNKERESNCAGNAA